MSTIPQDVLSEAFEKHAAGHRLVAAAFLTFKFDPEFFEQEILPVILDAPVSHSDVVRSVQIEDALARVPRRLAVYYDLNGLVPGARPARLDVARIPVVHRGGLFHPKNVFALLERPAEDEDAEPTRKLVVASLSANVTRAGWWENVEACHIESITAEEPSRLRGDLRGFLTRLIKTVGNRAADDHASLREILAFLADVTPRVNRSTDGRLHPHFYAGGGFAAFLQVAAGAQLRGCDLEVISPYFDEAAESAPLDALIERFGIRRVRLFLPKTDAGEMLCDERLYRWVREHERIAWGTLPAELTRLGKQSEAKHRFVHAKVYRFFGSAPLREYIFTGSVNLTSPAHNRNGNVETGFLIDTAPSRSPVWWLEEDRSKPAGFLPASEEQEESASTAGSRLLLRYHWGDRAGHALWVGEHSSPDLTLNRAGVEVLRIAGLEPGSWTPLGPARSDALRRALEVTSILTVIGEREGSVVTLVQEEGMEKRPSLLLSLDPAEILRLWTLLSSEQRAAFIEAKGAQLLETEEGAALMARYRPRALEDDFFARFAGVFLSFSELEASVRGALDDHPPRERQAQYLLFGEKYDSLGNLLTRIRDELPEHPEQLIEFYVMTLCGRQMVRALGRDFPDFWQRHVKEVASIKERLRLADELRERVQASGDEAMPAFLDWFEDWFLKRARPAVSVEEP